MTNAQIEQPILPAFSFPIETCVTHMKRMKPLLHLAAVSDMDEHKDNYDLLTEDEKAICNVATD